MGYFEQLGDLLKNMVYMILYPFIKLFEMLLSVYTDTVDLASVISNFLIGFLSGIFVSSWIFLIIVGLSLVVLLRIYFFIRGSS
jgi:hypothetical protein